MVIERIEYLDTFAIKDGTKIGYTHHKRRPDERKLVYIYHRGQHNKRKPAYIHHKGAYTGTGCLGMFFSFV